MHAFDLFYVYAYDYLMSYERFYYYVTILWRIKSFVDVPRSTFHGAVAAVHNVWQKFLCRAHTHSHAHTHTHARTRAVALFMNVYCTSIKIIETRGKCIANEEEAEAEENIRNTYIR